MNLDDKITGFFSMLTGSNPHKTVRELFETNSYQVAEQDLGINWIDGKPIFRRVFQLVPGANSSVIDLTGDVPTWEKWTNGYWAGRDALQFISGFENAGGANGLRFNLINNVLAVFHQGETPTEITAVVEYTKV